VDEHVQWLKSKPGYKSGSAAEYRRARSSEQLRIAENLQELYTTAGVLLVDAQGHGLISAKIASTVHDTFHALMLAELDRNGKTTPDIFEKINLRLAQSVTARNALGRNKDDNSREIATMLYGEIRPGGYFRFVNFGHPQPLVFSAEYKRFMEIGQAHMVQFLALGLEIPEDNPDRNKYLSMCGHLRNLSVPNLPAQESPYQKPHQDLLILNSTRLPELKVVPPQGKAFSASRQRNAPQISFGNLKEVHLSSFPDGAIAG
jgi:hypothetical protein